MKKHVDVAVIGAGHAGLNAIKEILKVTDDWVLINGGPLGTTCARVGCMPSKVAIHLADSYKMTDKLKRYGVSGGEELALDRPAALEHVRDLRDTFVDLVLANTTDEMDGEHLIEEYAELLDPHRLRVGEREITADAIIVATGARSVVPETWRAEFADGILTVDEIFEQEELPASVAVIGLGPIGLEIGQALHRLGVAVTGVDHGERVSRIQDPAVNRAALDIFQREFPLWLAHEPQIERCDGGFRVRSGEREVVVEKLFLALGRRPNLARLRLDRLRVPMGDHGVPICDPETLRVGRTSVYLAGDAAGGIANLQRAAAQGRIAGWNSVHRRKRSWRAHTPMAIVFSEPNIACVGMEWSRFDERSMVVAEQRFGPVGRALIMGQNRGLLRVYAERKSGRIRGASMVGPRCEHLAHLLAWAIEQNMTVKQALAMPFYHPVIEEALQDTLQELNGELTKPKMRGGFATRWIGAGRASIGSAAQV
ncbi:dihydrolipoyl dehydrogenase [Thiohalocapsa halophila]|uniref:Dihydrolipoyl dehydrogenase n=1 Tax=Thiohalocapsa halophila TaxID=69359 RepID=A0ABS1CJG0_9GAMM|nr:dihydrolipoyl dehydrogenase [Thiohalocapsa halophila]MBK1632055.1 dihydrolipoyl dehydrogenase [Thiohalocapsa halophila]